MTYAPFGATTNLYTNPEVMNGRFPGQWFQLETGLAYNWHRHYDPTTGRYIQPDPLLSDESGAMVAGLPVGTITGADDGMPPLDPWAGRRRATSSCDGHPRGLCCRMDRASMGMRGRVR